MKLDIHTNGDVYLQQHDGGYIGYVDSDGEWRQHRERETDLVIPEDAVRDALSALWDDAENSCWEESDWPDNVRRFIGR